MKLLKILEGEQKAPMTQAVLQGMSQCYRAGVALRNFIYDKELIAAAKVQVPIISVGNIVAGGTGKTPFVQLLAKELLKIGKVAILSRGYHSAIEKSGKTVKLDATAVPEAVGDEPVLLARKLLDAMVFAGKKRVQSVKEALAMGAEIILLDDGMQHRQLARDIEIVVMDGQDLFGRGFYLPRGFLRDSPKRLREVDFIVVNSLKTDEQLNQVKKEIKRYTNAPIIGVSLQTLNSKEIKGKKVGAFCAIGKPKRFLQTLRDAGTTLVDTLMAFDHSAFTQVQLCKFSDNCKAQGAELLVCTEKDGVKLTGHEELSLPIVILKTELKIFSGEAYFIDLLQKAKALWSHYHE